MWKSYFDRYHVKSSIFAIDYDPEKDIEPCVKNFLSTYPLGTVIDGIFIGDQTNKTFLESVVTITNGNYDIIIDDGAHTFEAILTSFYTLWPHVNKGGYYIIED